MDNLNNLNNENFNDREYKNNNGNTILLTVIGVATLLVALVGATFAYFTASVSNTSAQSVNLTTVAPVSLKYTGQKISLPTAMPGDKLSGKTFTVENPSNSPTIQTYDLNLIIDNNTFTYTTKANAAGGATIKDETAIKENEPQLIFTISGASNKSTPMTVKTTANNLDLTDGVTKAKKGKTFNIVDDQRIIVGEIQTYTMGLEFVNKNYEQNNNKGKTFAAHIEISDPLSVKN